MPRWRPAVATPLILLGGGAGRSADRSLAAVAAGAAGAPHRLAPAAVERRRKNSRHRLDTGPISLSLPPKRAAGWCSSWTSRSCSLSPSQRIRHVEDVERLLRWCALSAVIMASFGIVQLLAGNGKFFWFYEHPFTTTCDGAKGSFSNRNHFAQFLALGDRSADLVAPGRHAPQARARPSAPITRRAMRVPHAEREQHLERKRLGLSPESGLGRRPVRRPVVALAGRNRGDVPGRGSLDGDLLPHGVVGPPIHRRVGGRGPVDRRLVGDFRLRPRQQPAGRPFLRLAGKARSRHRAKDHLGRGRQGHSRLPLVGNRRGEFLRSLPDVFRSSTGRGDRVHTCRKQLLAGGRGDGHHRFGPDVGGNRPVCLLVHRRRSALGAHSFASVRRGNCGKPGGRGGPCPGRFRVVRARLHGDRGRSGRLRAASAANGEGRGGAGRRARAKDPGASPKSPRQSPISISLSLSLPSSFGLGGRRGPTDVRRSVDDRRAASVRRWPKPTGTSI